MTSLGKALIGDLKEAGFETLGDLWFHFPLRFEDRVRIDTPKEREYFQHGGILQYVVRQLASASKAA